MSEIVVAKRLPNFVIQRNLSTEITIENNDETIENNLKITAKKKFNQSLFLFTIMIFGKW